MNCGLILHLAKYEVLVYYCISHEAQRSTTSWVIKLLGFRAPKPGSNSDYLCPVSGQLRQTRLERGDWLKPGGRGLVCMKLTFVFGLCPRCGLRMADGEKDDIGDCGEQVGISDTVIPSGWNLATRRGRRTNKTTVALSSDPPSRLPFTNAHGQIWIMYLLAAHAVRPLTGMLCVLASSFSEVGKEKVRYVMKPQTQIQVKCITLRLQRYSNPTEPRPFQWFQYKSQPEDETIHFSSPVCPCSCFSLGQLNPPDSAAGLSRLDASCLLFV